MKISHRLQPEVIYDKGGKRSGAFKRAAEVIGSAIATRTDSWVNTLTGIGVKGFDRMTGTKFERSARLTDQYLDGLFNGDDMAATIIEKVVEDSLRGGYEISVETDDDDSDSIIDAKRLGTDVERFMEDSLNATEKIADAWAWGRLFGWGALFLSVDDGLETDLSEPLDPERVRTIDALITLDKQDVVPHSVYEDPANAKVGQVETYRVDMSGGSGRATVQITGTEVHESRLIVFEGSRTTNREKQSNDGFCLSVLQRVNDTLCQFNISWASLANMLQASSQGVFKMQGLIDMIAGNEQDVMQTRMGLVDLQRSVARSLVIDKEEDFQQIDNNVAGVPDALRVLMMRIASAAKMPLTVLMGMSPAGLNSTGESDLTIWAQTVENEQTRVLKSRLTRLAEVVMLSKEGPTGGRIPDAWETTFPAVIQMTDEQRAEIKLKTAQADSIYIRDGVLLPEEVAISRFPQGGFSTNTTINVEDRRAVLEESTEPEAEPAEALPAPEPTQESTETPKDVEAVDPTTALNGAQVKAMQDIIAAVIAGQLPRQTGIRMMAAAFPMSEAEAERIMDEAGQGFVPGTVEAVIDIVPGAGPAPDFGKPPDEEDPEDKTDLPDDDQA